MGRVLLCAGKQAENPFFVERAKISVYINLDQNKIMKVFTLVSLMLMPPTLIASFFGMNIQFGWFIGHSYWTWIIILVLMVVSIGVIFWIFKSRKMF